MSTYKNAGYFAAMDAAVGRDGAGHVARANKLAGLSATGDGVIREQAGAGARVGGVLGGVGGAIGGGALGLAMANDTANPFGPSTTDQVMAALGGAGIGALLGGGLGALGGGLTGGAEGYISDRMGMGAQPIRGGAGAGAILGGGMGALHGGAMGIPAGPVGIAGGALGGGMYGALGGAMGGGLRGAVRDHVYGKEAGVQKVAILDNLQRSLGMKDTADDFGAISGHSGVVTGAAGGALLGGLMGSSSRNPLVPVASTFFGGLGGGVAGGALGHVGGRITHALTPDNMDADKRYALYGAGSGALAGLAGGAHLRTPAQLLAATASGTGLGALAGLGTHALGSTIREHSDW